MKEKGSFSFKSQWLILSMHEKRMSTINLFLIKCKNKIVELIIYICMRILESMYYRKAIKEARKLSRDSRLDSESSSIIPNRAK